MHGTNPELQTWWPVEPHIGSFASLPFLFPLRVLSNLFPCSLCLDPNCPPFLSRGPLGRILLDDDHAIRCTNDTVCTPIPDGRLSALYCLLPLSSPRRSQGSDALTSMPSLLILLAIIMFGSSSRRDQPSRS
jgi:hypothetical protein